LTQPILVALGLVGAGLALVIGLQLAFSGGPEVPDLAAPRRPSPLADPRPAGGEGRGQDSLGRALARPLFSADRRPAVEREGASGAQTAPPEAPRLAGILVTAEGRHAIFAAGDRSVVVSEGESIGGFRITGISGEQVSIVGPQGTRILRPSFLPASPEGATRGGPTAGTEAAFNANLAPSGLDILRNAARQAAVPTPVGTLPPPVPGAEQTGVGAAPASARPQGSPRR
jgi:hypothetical protein